MNRTLYCLLVHSHIIPIHSAVVRNTATFRELKPDRLIHTVRFERDIIVTTSLKQEGILVECQLSAYDSLHGEEHVGGGVGAGALYSGPPPHSNKQKSLRSRNFVGGR